MRKRNFLDRLFPARYDFYGMLREQADITAQGVNTTLNWLEDPTDENFNLVISLTIQADIVRLDMEEKLIDAFATPFDRQDLYYISVRMDRVIEHVRQTMQSIKKYAVQPDEFIVKMMQELSTGTLAFAQAVALLENDPIQARSKILTIRKAQFAVADYYQDGMAALFNTADAMKVIKHYEINSQLRDAASYLGRTVDVLHRIVVRLV